MSTRRQSLLATVLVSAWWMPASSAAPLYDQRLCLVDVIDGKPTQADFHDAWRMVSDVVFLPARVPPLIKPHNRRGAWTVDESRRFVPYPEPVPSLASIQRRQMWTADPNTGQIIALGGRDRGLLSANRDDRQFARIHDTAPLGIDDFVAPLHVSRLGGTLIAATNGVLLLKGEGPEQLSRSDQLAPVLAMADLPRLGATIFITNKNPQRDFRDSIVSKPRIQITARTDDGRLFVIALIELGRRNYFQAMDVLQDPDRIVIRTQTTEWLVPISRSQEGVWQSTVIALGSTQDTRGRYLRSVDRYVQWAWTGGFLVFFQTYNLRNVGPNGYEDIPGDSDPVKREFADARESIGVTEVPWRHVAIFTRRQGLYVYNGRRLSKIPKSGPLAPGARVYAVPSISKVILSTSAGIFDLSPDGAITSIPVPFGRGDISTIGDMPSAHLGLISAGDGSGIYSLDARGVVRLIPGSETATGYDPFLGVIPIRNEMLVRGQSGLQLLVDRNISGSIGCPTR